MEACLYYGQSMLLKKIFAVALGLAGGLRLATADVDRIEDRAAVTGKILAEKRDAVVLDVGYTALAFRAARFPRFSRSGDAEVAGKTNEAAKAALRRVEQTSITSPAKTRPAAPCATSSTSSAEAWCKSHAWRLGSGSSLNEGRFSDDQFPRHRRRDADYPWRSITRERSTGTARPTNKFPHHRRQQVQ